jgi:hypothetical protein
MVGNSFTIFARGVIYQVCPFQELSKPRINIHKSLVETAISLKILFCNDSKDFIGILNYKTEPGFYFSATDVRPGNDSNDIFHFFLKDKLHISIDIASHKVFLHKFRTSENFFMETNGSFYIDTLSAGSLGIKAEQYQ